MFDTATKANTARPSGAGKILDLSWGLARTATLVTGLELDVFTHVAGGRCTPHAIAQATEADERTLGSLLLALASLGLLERDGGGESYRLSPEATNHLVRGEPGYLGDMRHLHRDLNFRVWPRLTEAVRTGTPCDDLFAQDASATCRQVLPYLNALGAPAAEWIAGLVEGQVGTEPDVLDVGCGSGVYGRAVARRMVGARVTGIDRPELAGAAEHRAEEQGLGASISYEGGDFRRLHWGNGRDAVLLSNVLHGYDQEACRELLEKTREALRPGGAIVIHEFVPDTDRPTAAPIAALMGLEMALSSGGSAHTAAEYRRWLEEAGFSQISYHQSPSGPTAVLIALCDEAPNGSAKKASPTPNEEVFS